MELALIALITVTVLAIVLYYGYRFGLIALAILIDCFAQTAKNGAKEYEMIHGNSRRAN